METTKITLKSNIALAQLSDYAGRTADELRGRLIKALLELDYIKDSHEWCGITLECILRMQNATIEQFAKYCFSVPYPRLLEILKGIVIWGVKLQCPACGCEVGVQGVKLKCINSLCEFDINLTPEKKPFLECV